jgi:hypothetical protein
MVWETLAEGWQAKWPGLCGCNLAVLCLHVVCRPLCVKFTATQFIVVYRHRVPIRYTRNASVLCNNSPTVGILNVWRTSVTVACGSFLVTPRTLFCITLHFWWVLRTTELESFDFKASTPVSLCVKNWINPLFIAAIFWVSPQLP